MKPENIQTSLLKLLSELEIVNFRVDTDKKSLELNCKEDFNAFYLCMEDMILFINGPYFNIEDASTSDSIVMSVFFCYDGWEVRTEIDTVT